jgi:hypothetical protein
VRGRQLDDVGLVVLEHAPDEKGARTDLIRVDVDRPRGGEWDEDRRQSEVERGRGEERPGESLARLACIPPHGPGDVVGERAVRDFHAFGLSSGSGRVEHVREVVIPSGGAREAHAQSRNRDHRGRGAPLSGRSRFLDSLHSLGMTRPS